jgi:hypothetical protein
MELIMNRTGFVLPMVIVAAILVVSACGDSPFEPDPEDEVVFQLAPGDFARYEVTVNASPVGVSELGGSDSFTYEWHVSAIQNGLIGVDEIYLTHPWDPEFFDLPWDPEPDLEPRSFAVQSAWEIASRENRQYSKNGVMAAVIPGQLASPFWISDLITPGTFVQVADAFYEVKSRTTKNIEPLQATLDVWHLVLGIDETNSASLYYDATGGILVGGRVEMQHEGIITSTSEIRLTATNIAIQGHRMSPSPTALATGTTIPTREARWPPPATQSLSSENQLVITPPYFDARLVRGGQSAVHTTPRWGVAGFSRATTQASRSGILRPDIDGKGGSGFGRAVAVTSGEILDGFILDEEGGIGIYEIEFEVSLDLGVQWNGTSNAIHYAIMLGAGTGYYKSFARAGLIDPSGARFLSVGLSPLLPRQSAFWIIDSPHAGGQEPRTFTRPVGLPPGCYGIWFEVASVMTLGGIGVGSMEGKTIGSGLRLERIVIRWADGEPIPRRPTRPSPRQAWERECGSFQYGSR